MQSLRIHKIEREAESSYVSEVTPRCGYHQPKGAIVYRTYKTYYRYTTEPSPPPDMVKKYYESTTRALMHRIVVICRLRAPPLIDA